MTDHGQHAAPLTSARSSSGGAPAGHAADTAGLDRAELRVYTPAEAADILKVPETWLRRQAGLRRIRCTYLGKHLRFSDADLRDIVAASARPPRTTARRRTR